MKEIVEPLKKQIPRIGIIIILLIIQVYCELTLPSYTAEIVNKGIQNTNFTIIYQAGEMMILMVIISVFATILNSYFSSKLSSSYAKDLREIVFNKVLKFSNHELNHFSRSSLITRSTNDINQIQNILGLMFRTMLFAPILGIGSIIKVFELQTDLTWIIVVTFITVIILLITVIMSVMPYFRKIQEIIDKINRTSREILIGMPVIKAFIRQDYERKRFDSTNQDYLKTNLKVYRSMLILLPGMNLVLDLMVVLILYFGSFSALNGTLLTGDLIAFIQYSTQIVTSFVMIGGFMINLPRILVSIRRVNEVLDTEITINNNDNDIKDIAENSKLEFKNVTFQYPESEKETLKNINFTLETGKMTAIIGGTGSGKSTILNLIPRLQDVTSGEILINNENIKNYNLKTLREKISLAPQKALLFSGTVKSNIETGSENLTTSQIEEALNIAQVDFIKSLDEKVEQGGANFSGGQKQRLSIARAIVGKHDFYLFDDCFSALDMNTERKVKKALSNIKKESSMLIVSQRISTIMDADEIIVLDNGEIIDKGQHEELVDRCAIYREIVETQQDNMGVSQ
ncbi:ABC transporter ATP-binding protein [Methanosphaera sp.]